MLGVFTQAWKEAEVKGCTGFVLHKKLKLLKVKLKKWHKEVFGSVNVKLKVAEEELHILDLSAESRDLDDAEKARRVVVRDQVWRLSRMVEWLWLQKSRLNWNLKGDRNTRFFHVMAKGRQSRNEISSISVGNAVYEDLDLVRKAIFDHFKKHFIED
ncbi:hypothetical protein ACSBR2_039920 [Camellia fascicularis]